MGIVYLPQGIIIFCLKKNEWNVICPGEGKSLPGKTWNNPGGDSNDEKMSLSPRIKHVPPEVPSTKICFSSAEKSILLLRKNNSPLEIPVHPPGEN